MHGDIGGNIVSSMHERHRGHHRHPFTASSWVLGNIEGDIVSIINASSMQSIVNLMQGSIGGNIAILLHRKLDGKTVRHIEVSDDWADVAGLGD
jgi:hypothetical protein